MRHAVDHRGWVHEAIRLIEADFARSADTHLVPLLLPPALALPGVDVYLKDESTHPTGSLKHRLARSLFLYALSNGWIQEGTTVIEASSGSTAISEAYFARLLGLPFIAVVPRSTAPQKCEQIAFYGGKVHFVERADQVHEASMMLAQETGGHFMDQFTFAERATDWRGNNNIAESVYAQMRLEPHPIPEWVVIGAGTGGTSATFGRFVRYKRYATRVAVADPEFSVFTQYHQDGNRDAVSSRGSRIEGIGRPRVEASFVREVIDCMIPVKDLDSIAAMRLLSKWLGRRVGPSTGTNLIGVLHLMQTMQAKESTGSLVSLICDAGERYQHLYDDETVEAQFGPGLSARMRAIEQGQL